jgi:hypothetical protein
MPEPESERGPRERRSAERRSAQRRSSERRSPERVAAFWRTVVEIGVDRRRALAALEQTFRAGSIPSPPDGFHVGRLVASTVGFGLDVVVETLSRLWMPWRGKTFDASAGEGWNVFDPRGRWVARSLWPRYDVRVSAEAGRYDRAFRFVTSTGESALLPGAGVLRIEYDLDENPAWPVRRVLDEVVEIDPGLLFGQALLDQRGRWRRAAWFSLEGPSAGQDRR